MIASVSEEIIDILFLVANCVGTGRTLNSGSVHRVVIITCGETLGNRSL